MAVDAGALAKQAEAQLPLALAQPHTAPAFPNTTVVGVEVWMWVPAQQWQPATQSVTAGATTVTATATPDYVTWNTGEGPIQQPDGGFRVVPDVVCHGENAATRAWARGMTDTAHTSCGHTYSTTSQNKPNGVFQLAASLAYHVTWTCAGACTAAGGDLGDVTGPASTAQLRSVQRQTVVVQ